MRRGLTLRRSIWGLLIWSGWVAAVADTSPGRLNLPGLTLENPPGTVTSAPVPAGPPPATLTGAPPAAPGAASGVSSERLAQANERLAQSNRDLLDLLKKQQGVLEDIQYDRRLQARQIRNLEEQLVLATQQRADFQMKLAKLRAEVASGSIPGEGKPAVTETKKDPPAAKASPPPPANNLPPEPPPGDPGAPSWHRLFHLAGGEAKKTDLFHITGAQWRVLWANNDPAGDAYKNTSALFISAFPKDDVIPQKVCSKLGTGSDLTRLKGPGNYYLSVEASGGRWELAVEELRPSSPLPGEKLPGAR